MRLEIGKVNISDCLEGLREIGTESIDTIITDPPYSSGARREAGRTLRGQDKMTRGENRAEWFGCDSLTTKGLSYLIRECALEWNRVLKDGGHALIFIDWRMSATLSAVIESADLREDSIIVWDKTFFGMGSCFRNQHEFILHFTKGKGTPPLRRDVGNVIQCKPIRNGSHPTEKPVQLIEKLISVVTPPGGIILDCFAGTGATGVAARNMGRKFIGIEREKGYADRANGRLAEMSLEDISLQEEGQE